MQVTAETQRVPLHGRPAPEVGRAAGGVSVAAVSRAWPEKGGWIGLRENLQENPIFNGKIYGFL